ncbi:hypothetical protein ACF07B_36175 [Streptomyces sp. NPDC015532]|uniref:hypothetical protein n=1 Tax=Streptomyces sp. NPDC015532 TaxID=3364960 RepID=UPI0036F4CF6C
MRGLDLGEQFGCALGGFVAAAAQTWQPDTYLKGTFENMVRLLGQAAAITKLISLLGANVDTATVVAAVTAVDDVVANAVVRVSVDVTGPAKEG